MKTSIELEEFYGAHHYRPLPVVLVKGEGIYAWDDQGKRYTDMMSAYSALSHGHRHPRIIKALIAQAQQLTLTSRAFYSDKLGLFLQRLCEVTGYPMAMIVNTGVEAVEVALKAARKWAYTVKGVASDQAEIIVCHGNFHGRTIAVISASSEAQYKAGFGPLLSGYKMIPYGDAAALRSAITANTAAFLVEPIQGEAGIVVPPAGYLTECASICRDNNVLLLCDEIQTGLGRTGKLLACNHEQVIPDGIMLGKALGGGVLPVSAFLARKDVMEVFHPGDHGSTFGGNALACAVAMEAINILFDEKLAEQATLLGKYFLQQLQNIRSPIISSVRGLGLLIGMVIDPKHLSARQFCMKLLKYGILSKETHETVVRLAPPLIITKEQIDEAMEAIVRVVHDCE